MGGLGGRTSGESDAHSRSGVCHDEDLGAIAISRLGLEVLDQLVALDRRGLLVELEHLERLVALGCLEQAALAHLG